MKKAIAILAYIVAVLAPKPAHALDLQECSQLATQYAVAPYQMPVGQLDTLRLCIADQMRMIIEEKRNEREGAAIEKNFGGKTK